MERKMNIHAELRAKFGQRSLKIYRRWEKFECKMADFQNHRCFSLRCLSNDLIRTSIRLKSTIKTPKGKYIIRKAELALLNERIRAINNSIAMFETIINTCMNQLEGILDEKAMEDCSNFIKYRREGRHQKTLQRQVSKYNRLCHKNLGGRSNSRHGDHDENCRLNTNTCRYTASANITVSADRGDNNNITNSLSNTRNLNTSNSNSNTSNSNISNTSNINNNNKWVRNYSKTPLTEAQHRLLSHGPNFVITPRELPTLEYIVATEKVCNQLTQGKAEELRGEVKTLLRRDHKAKSNIPKDEYKVLKEMKKDDTRQILTADKGVSMVVLDSEDYTAKSETLLQQSNYKGLKTDPTNKYKNKLIALLKTIKAEGGMDDITYKRLYPTGAVPPKYYGLPNVHKPGMPLRPIISSVGSVTHATAKELTRIIKPLVGGSQHHVRNNKDFIHSIKGIQLTADECMMSFDVESLFTSVPVEPSIQIIKKLLEEDRSLHLRTKMTVNQISCLLDFCLKTTYFIFQGKFFEQVKGAAMGSPINPIVANLFMEDLEVKALSTAPTPPTLWKRFVDDTFIIIKKSSKESFLQHLNSVDDNIHFTCEEPNEDGSIAFLDMLITPDQNGRLNTSVYRKVTHTDQYLHWDGHHAISSKYSVVGTLFHRARTVCSTPGGLQKEMKHLHQSLSRCNYPDWAINRVKLRTTSSQTKKKSNNNNQTGSSSSIGQNLTLWFHTTRDSMRVIKTFASNMGLMFT